MGLQLSCCSTQGMEGPFNGSQTSHARCQQKICQPTNTDIPPAPPCSSPHSGLDSGMQHPQGTPTYPEPTMDPCPSRMSRKPRRSTLCSRAAASANGSVPAPRTSPSCAGPRPSRTLTCSNWMNVERCKGI
ncbi:hypothetical protein F751_1855 [Auxenochlorella protothecoides]|uniref:Uncharacterized protein n=1 Tax=Auxenochlorella protothecoides TaxID=3075 RepID=A0A087SGX2_AUXPR|nr:hypothetical protein F751_1855 [Auxenochlorella protothecoides]KFM24976.1 hypothetical protein F751_1855 [Auxenochlorella protothecoides]